MPATQVKICGIRDHEMLETALDAGGKEPADAGGAGPGLAADYIGLVFFPPSPRHVDLDLAADLARAMKGRACSVALTVNADDATLEAIAGRVEPGMFQLHGQESVARVAEIRARFGRPVIKAISVATAQDAERALHYADVADLILFDARPPANRRTALPGGNGVPFDWQALSHLPPALTFMLSGGLTPDNVAHAITRTGAAAVDVSSGVEHAPGQKDAALIKRFLKRAKEARRGHTR